LFPKDTTGDEVEWRGERERKKRSGEKRERARKSEESDGRRAGGRGNPPAPLREG